LLNNLGTVKYLLGEYESARALHEESLELRRELGDRAGIASSLIACGQVAAARGNAARGTRLLAASATMTEQIGRPRSPQDQAEIEETVSGMRSTLGDDAFAREWAAGQALSMDEAIDDALTKKRAEPADGAA
jgi:hypothetical protein